MDELLFRYPPRLQGKVGEAEPGQGFDGKWFFEIWLSFVGSPEPKKSMGIFGPWDTEKLALVEMRKTIRLACDKLEEKACGQASGKFYDMQTSELRDWDEN